MGTEETRYAFLAELRSEESKARIYDICILGSTLSSESIMKLARYAKELALIEKFSEPSKPMLRVVKKEEI